MSWRYEWRPYVPVAQRRANAARELAKINKRTGGTSSPISISGRKITTTFWGQAWCDNLEAYSDYENRLPRGRTYVRNGSVVDLQIAKGKVTALVAGSSLYRISVGIQPLSSPRWRAIRNECAGGIDSLLELLQGKLSNAVMQVVTHPKSGLFPAPNEIKLDCSCPDWADMCKHVAAVLYGVGARLDQNPALLFELRGIDPSELVSKESATRAVRRALAPAAPAMSDADVAQVFGIELDTATASVLALNDAPIASTPASVSTPTSSPTPAPGGDAPAEGTARVTSKASARAQTVGRMKPPKARAKATANANPKAFSTGKRTVSPAIRARVVAAARARWAKLREAAKKRTSKRGRPSS